MENNQPKVKLNENPEGTVSFATDVVATIAGLAANEVEGVAGMSSRTTNSSFADILTRKSSRNYTKGVKVDIADNKVAVDVTIIVDYGSPVPDVAKNIQENIKKAIETMSGLDVLNVDVHVQGVSFEKENKAAAELSENQKKFLENSSAEAEKPAATVVVEPEAEEPVADAAEEVEIPEEELEYEIDLPDVDEEETEEQA
jgi:uncharacterized alkaline shock family protein YloU